MNLQTKLASNLLDERHDHEERVGRIAQRLLGSYVFPMHRQLVYGEPSNLFDLSPRLRLKCGRLGHIGDDVEANDLVVYRYLQIVVVNESVADVEAGLLEDLANRALRLAFLFDHFALGKAP